MRICYVLLSSTFGMHQYTSDPANQMARAGHDVHLVTTTHVPRDRYAPSVMIHTPVDTTNTGFSVEVLRLSGLRAVFSAICDLRPDVVHITGPHLWNVAVVRMLKGRGIPVVHTLHDLDPHSGAGYGALLLPWNWMIVRSADHILVHGQMYRQRVLDMGLDSGRVTCTPLLHLFLSSERTKDAAELALSAPHEPWALFFGRVEQYKGVGHLMTACEIMDKSRTCSPCAVIAGRGNLSAFWPGPLPEGVQVRNHLIGDDEALDLFYRCGVLVLPYIDATQSALVAAAYYFGKPVVVTRTGALPEYVEEGLTGHVVEPGQPGRLARCLEDLLGDPDRLAQMGAAGRAWYDEHRKEEGRVLLQMYDRVARRQARRGRGGNRDHLEQGSANAVLNLERKGEYSSRFPSSLVKDMPMRVCYVLLSSTFGMHQYTSDPANQMARAGHDVHLVTTTHVPRDRYAPNVTIHTPVDMTNTGFSRESLRLSALRRVLSVICDLCPDVVHFSGPHLWNVFLVRQLSARGIPVIHTLHDLDPHVGVRFGLLIQFWNRLILSASDHILVHGQVYRDRLLKMGISPERVTCTPLLFLFLGDRELNVLLESDERVEYQPWCLFFGRLEKYKGIECLLTACSMMNGGQESSPRVVVAGSGDLSALWPGPLPQNAEIRNRFIEDAEAVDLFRRCGVVVLPYVDATQSAQVASAYYFGKPVVVTRTGALPEYVEEGLTGHVVEPGQPARLARYLENLLGDPDRLAQMGAAGRAWYDEQRKREADVLLGMYDRIARQNARR